MDSSSAREVGKKSTWNRCSAEAEKRKSAGFLSEIRNKDLSENEEGG